MTRTVVQGPGGAMLPVHQLRARLVERRRVLFEQVAHVEDDLRWLDSNVEPESVEEGQEQNIARLLARLDDMGKAEIEAIDRALVRIARGDYGRCISCGTPIPVERLEALPAAEECVPCARAHAPMR